LGEGIKEVGVPSPTLPQTGGGIKEVGVPSPTLPPIGGGIKGAGDAGHFFVHKDAHFSDAVYYTLITK